MLLRCQMVDSKGVLVSVHPRQHFSWKSLGAAYLICHLVTVPEFPAQSVFDRDLLSDHLTRTEGFRRDVI